PDGSGAPVRIAFVGNQWKRKGGDRVLEAHRRTLSDRAELHLFGAGAPDRIDVPHVMRHGPVERDELLNTWLPRMDVFVLASREDMLPWAAIEAAAAGLPVVAPCRAGLPEVVRDGETGLLFAADRDDDLAVCLSRLVGDADLRRRMGDAAVAHVTETFNADRNYPALMERLVALADGGMGEWGMGGWVSG
ncbi:MAG: hypothetical protein CMJ18_17460, partial [Phycisphaeraceae bacterium]|nr:hypothetical protein [Phycisphaeraceae bacterium]